MSTDIDKAIKLLSELLGSEGEEESEDYNEMSDETEYVASDDEQDENIITDNLFTAFSGNDDKRIALLSSIKPYMNGKRQGKIDTAIQIVRFISLSSGLGITNLFK